MRVRAWSPGHLQSSATEGGGGWAELGWRTPARDQEGMSGSQKGDLGSQPSNVPFSHSWDTDLEGALALGTSGPSGLLLPRLKQGPGGFLSLLVDGGLGQVGQWLKGGIWPDLIASSLALPVLPGY